MYIIIIAKHIFIPPPHIVSEKLFRGSVLTCFYILQKEKKKNVCENRQMSPKTCDFDPIPASLLFECYNEIARVLLDIVNDCLSTSSMIDSLKRAIVKPFLKKSSLDPNVLKYFRPVSNLP